MNKSKCKTKSCGKWHPTLKDIKDAKTFQESNCCKCNEKIINCVIEHEVKPASIVKGIVKLTGEEVDMITYLLEN